MFKIDDELLGKLSLDAKRSARKRVNLRMHKADSALVQRMVNCLEPGTYTQPHKHENPNKDEVFVVLKGKLLAVEFNDKGDIIDSVVMDAKGENKGVQFTAGMWHTFIALESGSCVFECKDGPYDPNTDKVFASWAPKEGDRNTDAYMQSILHRLNHNLEAKISFSSVVKSRM